MPVQRRWRPETYRGLLFLCLCALAASARRFPYDEDLSTETDEGSSRESSTQFSLSGDDRNVEKGGDSLSDFDGEAPPFWSSKRRQRKYLERMPDGSHQRVRFGVPLVYKDRFTACGPDVLERLNIKPRPFPVRLDEFNITHLGMNDWRVVLYEVEHRTRPNRWQIQAYVRNDQLDAFEHVGSVFFSFLTENLLQFKDLNGNHSNALPQLRAVKVKYIEVQEEFKEHGIGSMMLDMMLNRTKMRLGENTFYFHVELAKKRETRLFPSPHGTGPEYWHPAAYRVFRSFALRQLFSMYIHNLQKPEVHGIYSLRDMKKPEFLKLLPSRGAWLMMRPAKLDPYAEDIDDTDDPAPQDKGENRKAKDSVGGDGRGPNYRGCHNPGHHNHSKLAQFVKHIAAQTERQREDATELLSRMNLTVELSIKNLIESLFSDSVVEPNGKTRQGVSRRDLPQDRASGNAKLDGFGANRHDRMEEDVDGDRARSKESNELPPALDDPRWTKVH